MGMKTVRHALGAVLALCIAGTALAADQKWTEYKYKEDHFAISEPVAPQAEFKTQDRPGGKDVRHAYVYYPDGGQDTIFVVQVGSKIPKDPRSDSDLVDYAARNIPVNARLPITAGNVKGVAFMYDTDAAHKTLIHAFAHDGFTYIVQVIVPKNKFPHPLQDRWMDSFRILDANGK
jgi:hypothetical protein